MNLHKKKSDFWWYRTLQVIYVFIVALTACAIAMATYEAIPKLNKPLSSYRIYCNNGIVLGDFKGWDLTFNYTEFQSPLLQESMRFFCSRPDVEPEDRASAFKAAKQQDRGGYTPVASRQYQTVSNPQIPEDKNYEIVIEEEVYDGSWWAALAMLVGSSIAGLLLALLIRAIFLYIAFKESFLTNIFVFRIRVKGKHLK